MAWCLMITGEIHVYTEAPGDFAPEMQKRALEKRKKEPLKITIDCNVKPVPYIADLVNGM